MINTEYLAISAIFLGGFYLGFKVKGVALALKEYLKERREILE